MPTIRREGFRDLFYEESTKNPPSPEYTFSPGGNRARRTIEFAWDRRDDAVKMFTGFPVIKTDALGRKYVSRSVPEKLDDFTGGNVLGIRSGHLWATQVERMEGVAPTGFYDQFGVAEYQRCRMTLVYESVTFGVKTDNQLITQDFDRTLVGPVLATPDESTCERFVTLALKPAAEFISIGRGVHFWLSDGLPVDFASSRMLQFIELHLIWRQVPVIPAACATHVGCVNSKRFIVGSNNEYQRVTFEPETLLLLAADTVRYRLPSGYSVFDVTYRIKNINATDNAGNKATHNRFLRYKPNQGPGNPGGGVIFDQIGNQPVGGVQTQKVYEAKDFDLLFYPQAL